MKKLLLFVAVLFVALGCAKKSEAQTNGESPAQDAAIVINDEQPADPATIGDIPLPDGFERVVIEDTTSFAYFLRNLPLKPLGTPVYSYDGREQWTSDVAYAVIDAYQPSNEDLQQCADAIIRLRAEWLYKNKRYDEIAFHFTNGWLCEYKRWAEGERVAVNGNKTSWYKAAAADYSYPTFLKYLNMVFNYAGTLSLSKELKPVDYHSIQIGDVFIQGGSPGHAIIIVDVAKSTSKERPYDRCFLVAESYMPAQDIHIIKNMNMYREDVSPWHLTRSLELCGDKYNFKTWEFELKNLKRF